MQLQTCSRASAVPPCLYWKILLGLFVSSSDLHKEAALPPLTETACPFSGTTPKAFFFPAVFPTSQTENPPGSPHPEWHCQALPCAEFYYAGAVLTPKRPHSMKNVPSGLWLTLPLSSKHFLSTTLKLLHQQSRTSLFPPVPCSLSARLLRLWRAAPSPCSAHSTPATGAYSCQKDPIQGNKCFATPLQLVERRGQVQDLGMIIISK